MPELNHNELKNSDLLIPELNHNELKNKLWLIPELNQSELKNKLACEPELKNKLEFVPLLKNRELNQRSDFVPLLNHKELKNKLGSVWLLKNKLLNQSWSVNCEPAVGLCPTLGPTKAFFTNEETVNPLFWTLSCELLLVNATPPILALKAKISINAVTVFKILVVFAIVCYLHLEKLF